MSNGDWGSGSQVMPARFPSWLFGKNDNVFFFEQQFFCGYFWKRIICYFITFISLNDVSKYVFLFSNKLEKMSQNMDIRNDASSKQGKNAECQWSFHGMKGNPELELERKVSPRSYCHVCPNKSVQFSLSTGIYCVGSHEVHLLKGFNIPRCHARCPGVPPRRSCAIYVCSRSCHFWIRPFQNVPWWTWDEVLEGSCQGGLEAP